MMAAKTHTADPYWEQGLPKSKSKPMDAQWQPIKSKPTILDLVQDCAKHVGLYAALNLVLFYWQQAELLADQAAVPAMWVCALLAGYQLGKCVARGLRDSQ